MQDDFLDFSEGTRVDVPEANDAVRQDHPICMSIAKQKCVDCTCVKKCGTTGVASCSYSYKPKTKLQSTLWLFQGNFNPTKAVRGGSFLN